MPYLLHHSPAKTLAGIILASVALCSCIYEYPDPNCVETGSGKDVKVIFDWKNYPGDTPPGMSVYFYPADGGDFYSYNLPESGLSVALPDGSYSAATFNYDSEAVIVISDKSFSTLAFTTRRAKITDGLRSDYRGVMPPISREESEGQTVMAQPQEVWTATMEDVTLIRGDSVTLTPRNITASYHINVVDITNIHSVSRMSVSLSGLAGQYRAASGIDPGEVPVILPGSIAAHGEDSASGTMLTFGRTPQATVNTLRLYLWLTDGQKKVYEWDVASQIISAPDPMDVTITVKGVTLPDLTPNPPIGGGMEVDVDNWDVVNIELST